MQDADRPAGKGPWWQTARTVRQGFWMAGVFLALGVGQLAILPGSGPISRWVHLGIGVGSILVGTAYLATTIALRRQQGTLAEWPRQSGRDQPDSGQGMDSGPSSSAG